MTFNRSAPGAPRLRPRGHEPSEESFPPPCREEDEHVPESASAQTLVPDTLHQHLGAAVGQLAQEQAASAQTLQETPAVTATSLLSLQALVPDTTEVSLQSGSRLSSSIETLLWSRLECDWGLRFYVRVDRQGSFHTYPDVGGPFQSLQEVDNGIDCYLHDRRDPKMSIKEGEGVMERIVRQCLYWPDGRIQKRTRSSVTEGSRNDRRLLVQALVDKYNDDHNLLGDLAHELKDVVHYQSICENWKWHYHLNFTTKSKGADDLHTDIENLFFVEVNCVPLRQRSHRQRSQRQLSVSCCCVVNPSDNGQRCYGCTNHGNVDMKHPDSSVQYHAGRLDVHFPFGGCSGRWSDSEDDDDKYLKAKEARIRDMASMILVLWRNCSLCLRVLLSWKTKMSAGVVGTMRVPEWFYMSASNKPVIIS